MQRRATKLQARRIAGLYAWKNGTFSPTSDAVIEALDGLVRLACRHGVCWGGRSQVGAG